MNGADTSQGEPGAGSQIGRSLPRLESREKVTGRAEYTHTKRVDNMLHAKLFRSAVPHGLIKSVDVSAALDMPGVRHVVTIDDVKRFIPIPYYGPAFHDQPILADGKVRFIGEPVAAVLADDPHVAETAVQLIVADYRELPAVFDEIDAFNGGAILHDQLNPSGAFADLKHLDGKKNTNVALSYQLRRGDFDTAYLNAPHKFVHSFKTQKVIQLPLEPFATIADFRDDHVIVDTSSQSPSFVRTELARLLGWPENRVRVRVPYLGGGYGAKVYVKLEALALALSMIARRPVKVASTMEEMFYQVTRHPCTFRIKSGVSEDGTIVARKCEIFWNGGAYADIGPRVSQKAGLTASGPYAIDNVSIDSHALYTNLTPSGALRGFGIPQVVWAYESHTDMVARELGIDPIEFRRRNLIKDGGCHAVGQTMSDVSLAGVIDTLFARMNWSRPFDRGNDIRKRGRGVAVAAKAIVSPTTSVATLSVSADGSITLYHGSVDMGQGSDTAMAQLVGELFGTSAEAVRIVKTDTDITPYDMGTLGSRSVFHMGNAIRSAAADVFRKIEVLREEVGEPEGSNIPLPELLRKRFGLRAGNVIGTGYFKPDYVSPSAEDGQSSNVTPFWVAAGAGAELAVDTETGHLKVEKLVNVVDTGTAINPRIVESQISGAAIMHLGFTLFENINIEGGQITNASLADYKIPGFHDIPEQLENIYIETFQSNGPFGAKGVGESASFCVSPAIANALEDAVGVRLTELPLSPEAILRALSAKAGRPIGAC